MARATVKTFRPEAGFGTLLFDDGTEMPFDIAASNKRDVCMGDACEVTVGVGRMGRPKVTLVEFALLADRTVTLSRFVAYAHDNGLLLEWTEKDAASAAGAARELDRAEGIALFEAYYGHGATERARRERVLVLDWRHGQETADVVGDFAIVSGLEGDASARPDPSFDVTGTLQPLAEWFDDVLAERRRAERWTPLPTAGDFEVFVLRDPNAVRQTESDLALF